MSRSYKKNPIFKMKDNWDNSKKAVRNAPLDEGLEGKSSRYKRYGNKYEYISYWSEAEARKDWRKASENSWMKTHYKNEDDYIEDFWKKQMRK